MLYSAWMERLFKAQNEKDMETLFDIATDPNAPVDLAKEAEFSYYTFNR